MHGYSSIVLPVHCLAAYLVPFSVFGSGVGVGVGGRWSGGSWGGGRNNALTIAAEMIKMRVGFVMSTEVLATRSGCLCHGPT